MIITLLQSPSPLLERRGSIDQIGDLQLPRMMAVVHLLGRIAVAPLLRRIAGAHHALVLHPTGF